MTVRSAGAVPSGIAAMMRGDTNARAPTGGCAVRIVLHAWRSRRIQPRRLSSIQALALTIAASRASAFGRHRRFRGGRMNDTLHGGEAWSRPCQRDRGGRELGGIRNIDAGLLSLSRSLAGGNEAHFQRPKSHDYALDMPFNQVAIRDGGRIRGFRAQGWQDRSRR